MRALLCLLLLTSTAAAAGRGDSCTQNSDCGWDDPCMSRRCGKKVEKPVACEETAPKPGDCLCNEGMCTLRPKDPAHGTSTASCKQDSECAIDVATATCEAGAETLIGPIKEQGPVCTCSGNCKLEWSGPVACKTYRDCSYVRTPRLRPVPASAVPRPHKKPVRPCKDGEVDSVCTEGVCRIVAWKC